MKMEQNKIEEYMNMQHNLIQKERQERLAAAALTSETLNRLNISIDALPQKSQHLLLSISERQASMGISNLDPITIAHARSRQISQQLVDEYDILEIRQENEKLQKQIERNEKFIDGLKRELEESKASLERQSPNPGNVQEHLRQMKQKLTSYEEIYEKAQAKFLKLHVPEGLLPASLQQLAQQLAALRHEEDSLRQRAADVTLARQARDTLTQLMR